MRFFSIRTLKGFRSGITSSRLVRAKDKAMKRANEDGMETSAGRHLLLVGRGYLGEAVERVFGEAGWRVSGVTLGGADGTHACDVSDVEGVRRLAGEVGIPDAVVHCAASGRGGEEAYRRVYVDGCRNLTEVFPGVRVVFTSSSSVYGQTDGSVVTEESEAVPDRETGRLLLAAEGVVVAAGGVAARLSGIYGPGRSVILRKFLAGEAVIEEDGRRYLNQIHRDDAAAGLLRLVEGGYGGVFNVADSSPLSQLECFEGLSRLLGRPMPPSGPRDLDRKRGWTHKRVSNGKLRGTGWEPRYGCFLDAVTELLE
jgi:nucleoside-diphosphate-sugar epimerase